jgi:hypothetical protein
MTEAEAKEVLGIVPDSGDILKGAELRVFGQYLDQRVMMKKAIKEFEAKIKAIDEKLIGSLADHDCEKVMHGLFRVAIITKTNSRLDKEKLLKNGVPAGVIALSMVNTQFSYLDVREKKDED